MSDVPLRPGPDAPLVGRVRELAEITAAIGMQPEGAPTAHAVLVAGDAGVGKTRLLTTLRDVCLERGWRVVAGHCLDFGDSELAYLAFSEVIGRLVAQAPEAVERVSAEHPALARLRPGRRLMDEAGADEHGEQDATVPLDPGALYAGVHALLEAVAEEQPLLLVVEDTHWADSSTRDLLSFLLSRPFAGPVALVLSYRSDDLHRRHPLRRTVAAWARIPGVLRLQLGPLPAGDVRLLVRRLGQRLSDAEVERIVSGAEGNAFFVEELVAAASRTGHLPSSLPLDLADLLLVRLDVLGEAGNEVVRSAAVAGRRVSHALLSAAAGLSPETLEEGLRDAVEHHVLVPDRGDSYAFRHALLAEAVYDDLLPGERTRLHAAYSRAMSEGRTTGTAAELARHARRAHDPATALDASIRAGDEAMSVAGAREAATHYEAALDLLDDPGLGRAGDVADVAALGQRAVDALIASGNPPRALALAERLLDGLPDDAPAEQRTLLRVAAASAVMVAETRRDPLDLTTPALDELPERPTTLRCRLLHLHARGLHHAGRVEEAREVAAEALRLAESLDLPRLASDILGTLASFDREDGAPDDVERALLRATEAAVDTGARSAELRSRWLTGRWHYDRAELDQAAEAFAATVAHAERIGAQWAPYGFDARFALLQLAYQRGDWDRVLELGDLTGQVPPPIPAAIIGSAVLAVRSGRGDVEALSAVAALQAQWDSDGVIAITGAPAAVELYAYAGDPDASLRHHDEAVEALGRLWRPRFHGRVRLAAVTIAALSLGVAERPLAERERLAGEVTRVYDDASAVLRDLREVGSRWGPEGVAWAARLEAERLRFRWRADVDAPEPGPLVAAWRTDLAAFEAMSHVFETARSAARLGDVLRATGEPAEARVLADRARETARRLGARPLLDELGASTVALKSSPGARDALTPREREILALVAAGRTNGEIGRALFIATKTVSVHVSHVLAKLGAAGRTEAAAIARRDGLL